MIVTYRLFICNNGWHQIPNRASYRYDYRQDGKDPHPGELVLSCREARTAAVVPQGHQLVPAAEAFDAIAHHGHVEAVLLMRRLGFASCWLRALRLVLALVAARILQSKLATTRSWQVTSLPTTLGVADADADELYTAMDWLLQRQDRIEHKLSPPPAQRRLGSVDLSSSFSRACAVPWLRWATIETARKASCRSITAC